MIEEREIATVGFEEFFRRVEPVLSRAFAAGFGFAIGHDAAAEALTYAWRNWAKVAGLDNPAGYLYRIGERWALRHRRRDQPLLFSAPGDVGEHRFEPGLGPALEALSRRQRQAVVLVAGYHLSHAETAALLGVSRASVQNHVERGLAALRNALGANP